MAWPYSAFKVSVYSINDLGIEQLVCKPETITNEADFHILIPDGMDEAYLKLPMRIHIEKVD